MNEVQAPNPVQDSPRKHPDRQAEGRSVDYRVLVVDDSDVVRDTVAKILMSFGYKVSKAEDGIAAMSQLAAARYDVVFTDFDMPMMNGYRLSVWLKQESPGTRVVIMTAFCQAEVQEFMATGLVDRWLFKPFGRDVLCEALYKLELPGSCQAC